MVKVVGTNLRQYMDNVPVESENPFYINHYRNGAWTTNDNRFVLQEAYGANAFNEAPEDIDYFVVAVKAGFKVDIAIESSSVTRWNSMTIPPLDNEGEIISGNWDREVIGDVGGNQFLRFTMTAGGFVEISGGITNDITEDWSRLENQFSDDAMRRVLEEMTKPSDDEYQRVRFSSDGETVFSWESIKGNWVTGGVMAVILDGVEKIPIEEEGGVPEEQTEFVPEGEESTTKDDIGTWELIHNEYGHKWEIVELNSPTEDKTWAFYFDGVLLSAFADKNDALIALNFHYDNTVKYILSTKPTVEYDGGSALLYMIGLIFASRFMGAFL